MKVLIQSAFVTIIIFLGDAFSNTKKHFYFYVIIFLLVAGIAYY